MFVMASFLTRNLGRSETTTGCRCAGAKRLNRGEDAGDACVAKLHGVMMAGRQSGKAEVAAEAEVINGAIGSEEASRGPRAADLSQEGGNE